MPLPVILWIVVFIAANVGSALLFKLVSSYPLFADGWWKYFILGNVVGFVCPVSLVLALRQANANLVYAICWGAAFCVLQFATWWLFKEPLSTWQWAGVALVGVGILLLQVR